MRLTDYSKPTPLVAQALGGIGPGRVLDVGSHNGRNALYLARLGWNVVAIDTDASALAQLSAFAKKEGLSISTICVDIRTYAPEGEFDAILSLMVLHFLSEADIEPTIRTVQHWTRSGGINIITAFTDDNPMETRPYLFPAGSVREYYKSWNVAQYEEVYSSWIVPEGKTKPERYRVARLTGQKA